MGISTKLVQRWEVLKVAGITIKPEGSGVTVELAVDGTARLVQSLQRLRSGKGDVELADLFLAEQVRIGKEARRRGGALPVRGRKIEASTGGQGKLPRT